MGKSRQGVLRPATGRQLGSVRKCLEKKKWSARFQFRDPTRVTLDGPARASQAAAEKDRELIAAAVGLQPRSSRVEAASAAIKCLRGGQAPTLQDGPGSASTIHSIGMEELASMGKVQLRNLAQRTPGITRFKRNENGFKRNQKSCNDLLQELQEFKSAQFLPGCKGNIRAEAPVSDSAGCQRARAEEVAMKAAKLMKAMKAMKC